MILNNDVKSAENGDSHKKGLIHHFRDKLE